MIQYVAMPRIASEQSANSVYSQQAGMKLLDICALGNSGSQVVFCLTMCINKRVIKPIISLQSTQF